MTDRYLVWSHEHHAWWGPNHCGYVADIDGAGRYSRDEAFRICIKACGGWNEGEALPEIPVREEDALECVTRVLRLRKGPE